jgi:hypothetical protein
MPVVNRLDDVHLNICETNSSCGLLDLIGDTTIASLCGHPAFTLGFPHFVISIIENPALL